MSPSRPTLPMSGGCPCGAVRYEITSFPLLLYACHCTACQTASGSAFALNMPVAANAFRPSNATTWRQRISLRWPRDGRRMWPEFSSEK